MLKNAQVVLFILSGANAVASVPTQKGANVDTKRIIFKPAAPAECAYVAKNTPRRKQEKVDREIEE